jgi:hypothetical protein
MDGDWSSFELAFKLMFMSPFIIGLLCIAAVRLGVWMGQRRKAKADRLALRRWRQAQAAAEMTYHAHHQRMHS